MREARLTYDSPSVKVLFQLLRIALGKEEPSSLPNEVNWEEVYGLSMKQGVGAIACDGMLALENCDIDEVLKYKWMGQSMVIEQKYYHHREAIARLASFYHQNNIRMMLLKGYGLSLNYPRPEHRPSGDIDIFLKGDNSGKKKVWQLGDDAIKKQLGIKVDKAHDCHTVFQFMGQSVENHYDFVSRKSKRSSRAVDNKLKCLAQYEGMVMDVQGAKVELPCADLNAIFIMRHMGQHFAGSEISLRHILDWATFIETSEKIEGVERVNWVDVASFWEHIGISHFAECINSICERYLRMDSRLFQNKLSNDTNLINRVLNDIIAPEFTEKKGTRLISIIAFKTRRFYTNRWKRKLVFKEGVVQQFLFGSFAHFLRFKTIKE